VHSPPVVLPSPLASRCGDRLIWEATSFGAQGMRRFAIQSFRESVGRETYGLGKVVVRVLHIADGDTVTFGLLYSACRCISDDYGNCSLVRAVTSGVFGCMGAGGCRAYNARGWLGIFHSSVFVRSPFTSSLTSVVKYFFWANYIIRSASDEVLTCSDDAWEPAIDGHAISQGNKYENSNRQRSNCHAEAKTGWRL
jgi:hypothetical protein